ncbi:hypothetical protein Tco_0827332, partial [Tanacetum coccineum]
MHMHNFRADLKKLMWLLMKDLELELKGRSPNGGMVEPSSGNKRYAVNLPEPGPSTPLR